jgi:uncharacterized membrane protein YfcA
MNSDEIQSLVTKLVVMILSSMSGAAAMNNSQATAIATGAGAVAAVLFGVYQHWNMKKVPEKAVVVLPPATGEPK